MAVAPVLPWRKASAELLRDRLFWPAWCGVGTLGRRRASLGADELSPLLAFGLGGFAAGAALRQLVLATRRQGWRGLVGRANGGMIVHIGVIIIAVALAASNSFTHGQRAAADRRPAGARRRAHVRAGRGHLVRDDARSAGVRAEVRVDGGQVVRAAPHPLPQLRRRSCRRRACAAARPRTSTSPLEGTPQAGDTTATIKVAIKPMIVWLWIGGALMAFGTVLAAFPGRRRRRPTDPVSAPDRERAWSMLDAPAETRTSAEAGGEAAGGSPRGSPSASPQ